MVSHNPTLVETNVVFSIRWESLGRTEIPEHVMQIEERVGPLATQSRCAQSGPIDHYQKLNFKVDDGFGERFLNRQMVSFWDSSP